MPLPPTIAGRRSWPPCRALDWSIDGPDWPNSAASRFVDAGGVRWHVQDMGQGPCLLLVHGTAASTHSWAGLLSELVKDYRVIAMDLPGHGFSSAGSDITASLPGMAKACAALVDVLDIRPALVIGHSAGAALLAGMCLDRLIEPRAVISLNGAFLPWGGLLGQFFSPAAKLLANLRPVPALFARRAADRRAVERLVRDTGSTLTPDGIAFYQRLMCSPPHVAAALRMMANWDLDRLSRRLSAIQVPLHLVACRNDKTVPCAQAERLIRYVPKADVQLVEGLGHLGHEEKPALFARLIHDHVAALHLQTPAGD